MLPAQHSVARMAVAYPV